MICSQDCIDTNVLMLSSTDTVSLFHSIEETTRNRIQGTLDLLNWTLDMASSECDFLLKEAMHMVLEDNVAELISVLQVAKDTYVLSEAQESSFFPISQICEALNTMTAGANFSARHFAEYSVPLERAVCTAHSISSSKYARVTQKTISLDFFGHQRKMHNPIGEFLVSSESPFCDSIHHSFRWDVDEIRLENLPRFTGSLRRNVHSLDLKIFGLSELEVQSMDPQQRLVLEAAAECHAFSGNP